MADLSRRNVLQVGLIAVVSGTAGCASQNRSFGTDSPSSPSTDSPIPPEQITAYEALSEKGKELFQTLLAEGSIKRPSDKIPSKLWDAKYVRYEGTVYTISKTNTGRSIAEYTLSVSSVTQSEVNESELVIYSNLSQEAKDAFKQALNEGTYTIRGEDLPGKLNDAKFVQYRGNYYELQITVGDIRVWKISVSKIDR